MEKIVVNDTNVFIDLLDVGLLDKFFLLPWEIHTTDFVMLELLREGQKEAVEAYKHEGKLNVAEFDFDELMAINSLHKRFKENSNVSLTDCSVWYYAKQNNYILLKWCNASYRLWQYGMRALEERVSPTTIIVYGSELEVPGLHTPIFFIQDNISKHYRR